MNPLTWNERLRTVRSRLELDQEQMGRRLGVSREWVSKIERGHEQPSALIEQAIVKLEEEELHKRERAENRLKKGALPARVEESGSAYSGGVANRLPLKREPSSRADCEAYVAELFAEAERSGDPNAWPVILHRLRREFPLHEWRPPDAPSK